MHGSAYRTDERADLERPGGLEAWVDLLASYEVPGAPMPEGWVPASYRWILDDDRLVGTITVRDRLTDSLLVVGGHIGYAVRPSARRRGVATAALRLALGLAARHGIDPVLITCEDDNVASARTIEASGGVLEDVRGTSRRYWVRTVGAVRAVGPVSAT
jgi:predicted acetyltransferase